MRSAGAELLAGEPGRVFTRAIGATAWLSFKLTAQQIARSQAQAAQHVVDTAEAVRFLVHLPPA